MSAPEILGVRNTVNITAELWERAANNLTTEELEWFAGASSHAVHVMENMADVIERIGCLVNDDYPRDGKPDCVGYFQDSSSTAGLLFFLAESVRHVQAMVQVSDAASYRLRHPR